MSKFFLLPATALILVVTTQGAAQASSSDAPEPYSETNPSTTVAPNVGSTGGSAVEDEDGDGFDWGLLGLFGLAGLLGHKRRDRL